jgi:hypothetical protein
MPARDQTPSFVGRAAELGRLASGVDDAIAGRGRLLLLVGEPGIGKTSLADEAASAAAARGVPVSWGRAWEAGGAPAYWPWLDVLGGLAQKLDDTALRAALGDDGGPGGPLLAELVPALRQRLGVSASFVAPPADEARFRLWRAVVSLVRAAAAPAGLVLVFDDLHSADRSSLLLLYAVARELRSLRVLLVATCRDVEARMNAETSELITRVAREGTTLKLARLDRDAASALVRGRASALPADAEARIFDSTQGNPLFLVEMLRLLEEEGPAAIAAGVVPAGVRDVIRQRLEHVAGDARTLLDLAAVAGDELDARLLAAAAGRDDESVAARLGEATRAGVLAERAGRPRFSHALVREVLYRELPEPRRRALHGAVGDALARLAPAGATAPLMELAHHGLEGPPEHLERAVTYAVQAASRAVAVSAPEEAIGVLERARAALARVGDPPGPRAEVLLALAGARIHLGDSVPGKALCCEVATLARASSAPEVLARAALTYGRVFNYGVVDPVLVDLVEGALAALPPGDSVWRARLLARLAGALQPSDDPAEPAAIAREAIATARRLGDRRALLETLFDGISALMDVVDPRERRALNLEVEALAAAEGDRERLLRTYARLVIDHLGLGEVQLADARIDAFEELATELRATAILWRAPSFRSLRATMRGEFAEAATFAERVEELGRAPRDPQPRRISIMLREGAARAAERADEMLAVEPETRRERASYHRGHFFQSLLSALWFARLEDEPQSRYHLELMPPEMMPHRGNNFALALLGEPIAFAGAPDLVEATYEHFLPFGDLYAFVGMSMMQWEGPVSRLIALLAARLGRWDEAVARFDDAIARLGHLEARPMLARAQYELGRTLLARGRTEDRPRAGALLGEARALAASLDMPGLLRLVDARTGEIASAAPAALVLPAGAPAAPATFAAGISLVLAGEYWTLTGSGGRDLRLKDSLGLQYLARLVAAPGREIHVLELAGGSAAEGESLAVDTGDAGELLDDDARADYARRLEDLRDTLAEAESFGDAARAARAREEIDFLAAELGRAVGLGGRARRAGSAAERARSAVQRRIKNALGRISEADPALGASLTRAVRTGNFCVYRPPAS